MKLPHIFLLLCSCAAVIARAEELRVISNADGHDLILWGSDGATMQVQTSEGIGLAPANPQWGLVGSIRDSIALFHWLPDCTIRTSRFADIISDPSRPVEVDVFLRHGRGFNSDGVLDGGQLSALWPDVQQPAALVAVWMIDAEVRAVEVLPLPDPKARSEFRAVANRYFTPAEAARCRVGLGLLQGGRFVTPHGPFQDQAGRALLNALIFDDPAALDRALANGRIDAVTTDRGRTPLVRIATRLGAARVLKSLLQANPALRDDTLGNGETLLHLAAFLGRTEVTDVLLAAGSSANQREKNGQTPIQTAAEYGHAEIVAQLIKAGAPPNEKQGVFPSALEEALKCGSAETAEVLRQAGAKLPTETEAGGRLLIDAARDGRTAIVRWLLKNLDRSIVQRTVSQALEGAASCARPDPALAALLLEAGASPEGMGWLDRTPLTNAVLNGGFAFAETLLQHGAAIDAKNRDRSTALHQAASFESPEAVRFLVAHGASLQVVDAHRHRALEVALLGQSPEAAAALAAAGDRIDLTQSQAPELLAAAIRLDIDSVLQSALAAGWKAETPLVDGWSALQIASIGGGKCEALLRATGGAANTVPLELVAGRDLETPPRATKSTPLPRPQTLRGDETGTVLTFEVVIDSKGRTCFPRLKKRPAGSNFAEILEALEKWRFAPAQRGGKPVATRLVLPVKIQTLPTIPGPQQIGHLTGVNGAR